MAEDAWNSRDPQRVSLAYTEDSVWRNRAEFLHGGRPSSSSCAAVEPRARLPAHQGNLGMRREPHRGAFRLRVARRLGKLVRSYGNENWEFDAAA